MNPNQSRPDNSAPDTGSVPFRVRPSSEMSPFHLRRLHWAVKESGTGIHQALERDQSKAAKSLRKRPAAEATYRLVQLILDAADPSGNKRFTPWLAKEYAAGRLILEDLGTARETLELFQRYAARLVPEKRDVQRYENLASIWDAVRPLAEKDEALSGKAQRALDRSQAYSETRILRQDSDGFTVAVPLTEFAAKWWGRGTRWCTAATKGWNAFGVYYSEAPLIVLVTPDHQKFQLFVTSDRFEFRDAQDQEVSEEVIKRYWEKFKNMLVSALKHNANGLKYLPTQIYQQEWCKAILVHSTARLNELPKILRTAESARIRLKRLEKTTPHYLDNLRSIYFSIPREVQTPDFVEDLLTLHPSALRFLDPRKSINLDSPHIFQNMVEKEGELLCLVPERFKTLDLCLLAVQQNMAALEFVPPEMLTPDFYLIVMQRWPQIFTKIPQNKLTDKHCRIAFNANFFNLSQFPPHLQHPRYFVEALRLSPRALSLLPMDKRSVKRCANAIRRDGSVLRDVPKELRTADICRVAITHDTTGTALAHVPHHLVTYELSLEAVRYNGMAIRFVRPEFLTAELCNVAITQNPEAICEIPKERPLTRAMCEYAMAVTPSVITYVPECYLDEAMCLRAIESDPALFLQIPIEFKTFPVCLAAVKADPVNLEHLPPKMRRAPELVMAALAQPDSLKMRFEMQEALDDGVIQPTELPPHWKEQLEKEKCAWLDRRWEESLLDQWERDLNSPEVVVPSWEEPPASSCLMASNAAGSQAF